MDAFSAPDDRTLYVDRTDRQRGSKAPFYAVYTDVDGDDRWGFCCGHCDTTDNAVDAMGRIHCNECSNRQKQRSGTLSTSENGTAGYVVGLVACPQASRYRVVGTALGPNQHRDRHSGVSDR